MAQVNLILLEDVEQLGLAGTEVHVAPGYARNFLIPRGLAAKATPATLRMLAARQEKIQQRRAAELAAAQELAGKLADVALSISMQAASDDQLFGSVTSRMVADELKKLGFAVEHTQVKLEEPIKMVGSFDIALKLNQGVPATIKLWVVRA